MDSKHTTGLSTLLRSLLPILVVAISACASNSSAQYHRFAFDGWYDKWATQAELLKYEYGNGTAGIYRETSSERQSIGYQNDIHGTMPPGEYLYVKWRLKNTGEVIEKRIDLRGVLPSNMFEHAVTFVIEERQLFVYLVTPKKRKEGSTEDLKTYLSKYLVTYEVYPNDTFAPRQGSK